MLSSQVVSGGSENWLQALTDRPSSGAAEDRNEWIVRADENAVEDGISVAGVADLLNQGVVSFEVMRGLGLPGQVLVRGPRGQHDLAASLLSLNDQLSYFEPNTLVHGQVFPNDPRFGDLHALHNEHDGGVDINAPEAWDISTGSRDVVVAVIDSGVDYTHPDLYLNIWINPGEIPAALNVQDTDGDGIISFVDLNAPANAAVVADVNGTGYIDGGDLLALDGVPVGEPVWINGEDDDGTAGNGFVDDLLGWDFRNHDNNPYDDNRHGTHVAGTIAAVGNNDVGVTGLNWQSSILPLKFLDSNNSGSAADAASALAYARRMRQDFGVNIAVTNNSWGSDEFSFNLRDQVDETSNAGILVVAAAGNGSGVQENDNDAFPFYPASYEAELVLSVTASTPQDEISHFANYGSESVDLAAPGVTILSTEPGAIYATQSGTSMAAPHVTGAAAILFSHVTSATAAEVKQAILQGVDLLPKLEDQERVLSQGRLNVFQALTTDTFSPRVHIEAVSDIGPDPIFEPQTIEVRYTDTSDLDVTSIDDFDIQVRQVGGSGTTFSTTRSATSSLPNGLLVTYEMQPPDGSRWTALDNGTYEIIHVANQVADVFGNLSRQATLSSFQVDIDDFPGLFVVNTMVDTEDDDLLDGECRDSADKCSLRAAVMQSNARNDGNSTGNDNTIVLGKGVFLFELANVDGVDDNAAAIGDLDVTDRFGKLEVRGSGPVESIIDAARLDRVFHVQAGASLELVNLTLRGGNTTNSLNGSGAGVLNHGTLQTSHVHITGNVASQDGGGVYNDSSAELTLADSTIEGNTAGGAGGGLHNSGQAAVTGSTLAANVSDLDGAGLANVAGGILHLTNTTLSGNLSNGSGGGIYQDGASSELTVNHVTIAFNSATQGGGILAADGTVDVTHAIVANNTAATDPDVSGSFTSSGHNAIGIVAAATGFVHDTDGDLVGSDADPIDPLLSPLGDNRGPSPSHALLAGSPAIDAGDAADPVLVDQRGVLRPQDADGNGTPLSDIGAVERYFAEIRGIKFYDKDGDGVQDLDEPGLAGWTIYADLNANGVRDDGEPFDVTDANGLYQLQNLDPDRSYRIAEEQQAGWVQTSPTFERIFVVNSFADSVDATPGNGNAVDDQGRTTLRAAIMEANALPGSVTIIVPAGTYLLSIEGQGEDASESGDLDLTGDLILRGNGVGKTIIDGGGLDRVFEVHNQAASHFEDLTITGGRLTGPKKGGAIRIANGIVTILDSSVMENSAENNGGAIYIEPNAILSIVRSTVANNSTLDKGIVHNAGDLTVLDSAFWGNTGAGSAIWNWNLGDAWITNTTISGNSSASSGALVNTGDMTILNSTIAHNVADIYGGIQHEAGTLTIHNSIIANNSDNQGFPDIYIDTDGIAQPPAAQLTSLGHNLIGDVGFSGGFVNGVNGDQVGGGGNPIDPGLRPLFDYGGPTFTHALLPTSPAIGAGDNDGTPTSDQRGITRPQDGNGDTSLITDIGAYEHHRTLNIAPIVKPTFLHAVVAANVTPAQNDGIPVADLLAGVSDTNTGDALGIAIVDVNESHGSVQYSTDGGAQWSNVGLVSEARALLLSDDLQNRLRFQPDTSYIGTITDAVTLRGWDQTAGASGQRVNVSDNGGFTAYSRDTDHVQFTVSNAVGNEFRVNSTVAGEQSLADQARSAVAMNDAGEFVAVWQSFAVDNWEIRAQRYSPTGAAAGSAVIVNPSAPGDQVTPSVALSNSGDFVVVWQDGIDLYGRLFGPDGVPTGQPFFVDDSSVTNRSHPVVKLKQDGGIVVAYSVFSSNDRGVDVRARLFDSRGNLEQDVAVTFPTKDHQGSATLDVLPDGRFVVGWSDSQDGNVWAQRYDSNGQPLDGPIQLNSDSGQPAQLPSIAMDAGGGFIAAWEQAALDGDGQGVFARLFDDGGIPLGIQFQVNQVSSGHQQHVNVARDPDGPFVISWTSDGADIDGSSAVFGRRYRADGTPIGDEFRISSTAAGTQQIPHLAMDAGGDFVVIWNGNGPGDDDGVFAQRFETNDAPVLEDLILGALQMQDVPEMENEGVAVSEFLFGVSDSDDISVRGIAITAVNETDGQIQYSTDGGTAWTDLDDVNAANALLLSDSMDNRIRFLPAAGFLGAVDDAVTFRAWDQTSGSNAAFADATNHGEDSAFSAELDTFAFAFTDIYWDGGGDGSSWDHALNWSTDQVPPAGANVLIDDPAEITVNLPVGGISVGRLHAHDGLNHPSGTLFIFGQSRLFGSLSASTGSISASGPEGSLLATGSTSIHGTNVTAVNGGIVHLPALTTYTGASDRNSNLTADGAGSRLLFDGMTALNGADGAWQFSVQATNGGVVEFGALQGINSKNTHLISTGSGSLIRANLLTSWVDNRAGAKSELQLTDGGKVELNELQTISNVSIRVEDGLQLRLPSLQSIDANTLESSDVVATDAGSLIALPALNSIAGGRSGFGMNVSATNGGGIVMPRLETMTRNVDLRSVGSGSLVDMPALLSWTDNDATAKSRFTVSDGGAINIDSLQSMTGVQMEFTAGEEFTFPALQSYSGGSGDAVHIIARDAGTRVHFPSLTTIQGGANSTLDVGVRTGALIDMSSLLTITGGKQDFDAHDAGSVLDMSSLQSWIGTGDTATNGGAATGGELRLGSNISIESANIGMNLGGTITGGTLSFDSNSKLFGNGTVTGNVINSGGILIGESSNPGNNSDTLTIDGDYTQTSTGTLEIDIGGLDPGTEHDQLVVSGVATLDGLLDISLINGFVPAIGDNFDVVPFGARVGDFATYSGTTFGGGAALTPIYSDSGLTLTKTFYVTDTADATDANPGNGVVDDGTGKATLRASIQEANARPGDDIIVLGPGTYSLTLPGTAENDSETGDLDIADALLIIGAGSGSTVIDGQQLDRVFHVLPGVHATLQNLTVRNGSAVGEHGGGIRNDGTLTLVDAVLSQNTTDQDGGGLYNNNGTVSLQGGSVQNNMASLDGGGVANWGAIVVTNTSFSDNSARLGAGILNHSSSGATLDITGASFTGNTASTSGGALRNGTGAATVVRDSVFEQNEASSGGAIALQDSQVEIYRSTIRDNTADSGGGGISSDSTLSDLRISDSSIYGNHASDGAGIWSRDGDVSLTNVTLSGNIATGAGGGMLSSFGSATLDNVTVTTNQASTAGGITSNSAVVNLRNSVIAANTASIADPDLSGSTYRSLGSNFVGDIGGATGLQDGENGDHVGDSAGSGTIAPLLGPLQDNGGTTLTHAPLAGSPVIDAGNNSGVAITDQRSLPRSLDGDGDGTVTVDIGAVEYFDPSAFVVNSFADTVDANVGDGVAQDALGNTSLRAAIMEANADALADTIIVPAGTFKLTRMGIDEDFAATGDLDVTEHLTIIGTGAGSTIIDADTIDRVFEVTTYQRTLNVQGLTITGGETTGNGGAIRTEGHLNVKDVEIANNTSALVGGGIFAAVNGSVAIADSTISNNTAGNGGGIYISNGGLEVAATTFDGNSATQNNGGGIYYSNGIATIETSTFSNNVASVGNGGGIYVSQGDVTISTSTFSANTADRGGGLHNNDADVSLAFVTVTDNAATTKGGGFNNLLRTPAVANSIIAKNMSANGPDVAGAFASAGHNLIGDVGLATGFDSGQGDLLGDSSGTGVINPLLGPLADNGGPTLTHAISANSSPAVDAGDGTLAPEFDQRGVVRMLDGDNDDSATVDIGAVEFIDGFLVDSTLDTVDANPGDGLAADADGNATLRAAIMESNALGTAKTIVLPKGNYRLTLFGNGDNANLNGDLDITGDITLIGIDAATTVIDATGNADRVFDVLPAATLDLQSVTITGGITSTGGGGIRFNGASLTIRDSVVSDNDSTTSDGGGLYALGLTSNVTIERTLFEGNAATRGGAIQANSSLIEVRDSSLTANTATGNGGAINVGSSTTVGWFGSTGSGNPGGTGGAIRSVGNIEVTNITISSNLATSSTGGISVEGSGSLILTRGTVVSNSGPATDGVFVESGATANLHSAIVADNGIDLNGTVTSSGYNWVGNADAVVGITNGVNHDQTGTAADPLDPLLGPLQDNGGLTLTHAPLFGSPVIDAGNSVGASMFDQRGSLRTLDGNGDMIDVADIGAVEFALFVDSTSDTVDATPNDGHVAEATGNVTLRAAIIAASALPGRQIIFVTDGTYTISLGGRGEDNAANGDFDITDDLTIVGSDANTTVIDGNEVDRVFHVFTDTSLEVTGVTVTKGNPGTSDSGGGIRTAGDLRIVDAIILDNFAENGAGIFSSGGSVEVLRSTLEANRGGSGVAGGVFLQNDTTLDVQDSVFRTNISGSGSSSGGIYVGPSAVASVSRSTFDGNTGLSGGGGITTDGMLDVRNSTFVNNSSGGRSGGAIHTRGGETTVINTTITNNTSGGNDVGGGIYQSGGTVRLGNTIIADNWADMGPDVFGTFVTLGNNFIGDATAATGFVHGENGDQVGDDTTPLDPLLGPLQDNGGLGQTRLPQLGSPVIDAGHDSLASATDQLGSGRIRDGNFDAIDNVDIGAAELDRTGTTVTVSSETDSTAAGSLRAAIIQANATTNLIDTVILPPGTYVLDLSGSNEDAAQTGDLDIADHLHIVGAGADVTTIAAAGLGDRAFQISSGILLKISGVTIDGGHASGSGSFGDGGGFLNDGTLVIEDTVIQNSLADNSGGAIRNTSTGTVRLTNSTIVANQADKGAGVYNDGVTMIQQATFSGNATVGSVSNRDGGGTYNKSGTLSLDSATITLNTAYSQGGGIYVDGGALNIRNTIVAANVTTNESVSPDVDGSFNSQGNNLIGNADGSTGFLVEMDDIFGSTGSEVDARLGLLQLNHGTTPTHSPNIDLGDPQLTSPAVDAGNGTSVLLVDQRSVPRILDGDGDGTAVMDIGAVEAIRNGFFAENTADGVDDDLLDGVSEDDQ